MLIWDELEINVKSKANYYQTYEDTFSIIFGLIFR